MALSLEDLRWLSNALHHPQQGWEGGALCRFGGENGTDLFFPEPGEQVDHIKAICAACPARIPCLAVGLTERFGVWGGKCVDERKRIARQLRVLGIFDPPTSGRAPLRPECGTNAGYHRHRRRYEDACEACKHAHRLAHRPPALSTTYPQQDPPGRPRLLPRTIEETQPMEVRHRAEDSAS